MTDKYILNNVGEPEAVEDLMEWAHWYERSNNTRIVQQNNVGEILVSTVFLGMNMNFGYSDNDRPILYETMIFGGKHDQYQERYSTRDEAVVGHKVALKLVEEA